MTHKRVAIVGGGPAGAATALSLLSESSSAALDVTLYYHSAKKRWPIGETIPPAANTLLDELGVGHLLDPDVHTPCPGSVSVWGSDTPVANDFMLDLSGRGYHLDRLRFDSDLLAAAEKRGVQLKPDYRLCRVEPLGKGFELGFQCAGESLTVEADFVVDATGQSASFARRLPVARNLIDEVISIYTSLPIPSGVDLPEYTLVEATLEGWWYLSRIPGNRCILSLTTDKHCMAESALQGVSGWCQAFRRAQWLRQFLPVESLSFVTLSQAPACSAILTVCVGSGWLAVGDAACSYDSITSAGITKSLMQGSLAGTAIAQHFAFDAHSLKRYQAAVFDQFNEYIGVRNQLYSRERRFADAGFWQRRLAPVCT